MKTKAEIQKEIDAARRAFKGQVKQLPPQVQVKNNMVGIGYWNNNGVILPCTVRG